MLVAGRRRPRHRLAADVAAVRRREKPQVGAAGGALRGAALAAVAVGAWERVRMAGRGGALDRYTAVLRQLLDTAEPAQQR